MREYRTALMDNRRWSRFASRPDDVFICTPAKCGTTWTQTIVGNLLWPTGDLPGPVMMISPCPFEMMFEGGADGFLFKGTNGRWRDVLTSDELGRYHERASQCLPPAAIEWLEHGRSGPAATSR